jgi:hypothetical protein
MGIVIYLVLWVVMPYRPEPDGRGQLTVPHRPE